MSINQDLVKTLDDLIDGQPDDELGQLLTECKEALQNSVNILELKEIIAQKYAERNALVDNIKNNNVARSTLTYLKNSQLEEERACDVVAELVEHYLNHNNKK